MTIKGYGTKKICDGLDSNNKNKTKIIIRIVIVITS